MSTSASNARAYDCDVIVIGGGPAGSTAAALLAREGRRVMIVDRDAWPRYHIGESLLPGVLPFLDALGAREAVEALGFRRKTGQTFQWGRDRTPWTIDFRQLDVHPYAYFVERAAFDHALLKNAVRHGAALHEETSVVGLLLEGERVRGVRVRGTDGEVRPVTAPYVVDASGQNALVARHFETRRWVKGLRNLAVWSYWRGVAPVEAPRDEHIFTVSIPDGWVWLIPLRDGRTSVGVVSVDWTRGREAPAAGEFDLAAWYEKTARGADTIGARLAGAERVDEVRAQRDWSYCTTRFHGPGYCLAGDAACFIDPILSTGVQLAMTGGYLSALAVHSALAEPANEAAFFRYYQQSYLATYREQLTQVRYFYRTEAHRESVFWKSKRLLRVDPQLDGSLAFMFLNSGLARHVTAERPHDLPGQARAAFPSLRSDEAPAAGYGVGAAQRQLVEAGGLVVVEGADRRLYGVVQRGMRLHLEPSRSSRWRDRPAGSAVLFEVAATPHADPAGNLLVERRRPEAAEAAHARGELVCVTRAYRDAPDGAAILERAARDVLARATPADATDLAGFELRMRRELADAPPTGWSLSHLPPIDRVSLTEHPVAAEYARDDGASIWVVARTRQHPHVNESPFDRTRFIDLEYRTGHGAPPDDEGRALVASVVGVVRRHLRDAASVSSAIQACEVALQMPDGLPAGWSLRALRRMVPNTWADEPVEALDDEA